MSISDQQKMKDSPNQINAKENKVNEIPDKRRFMIAIILSLSLMVSCEFWISFSTIKGELALYLNLETEVIDYFNTAFLISYFVESIPSLFIPQYIGLKNCIIIGSFLNFIGSGSRTIGFLINEKFNKNGQKPITFTLLMLGNIFASFAQGFILNIPTMVSMEWFPENERVTSITWITNGSILGTSIGFIFAPLLVYSMNIEEITKQLKIYSCSQTSICFVILVLSLLFVKNRVTNTVNKKQLLKIIKTSFKSSLVLLKCLPFWSLFIVYALYNATSMTFYVILYDIV